MGRIASIKQWSDKKSFTLHKKEFDLFDHVVEESIENENGVCLLKKRNIYDKAGRLQKMIAWPQNIETVVRQFEYDSFSRLIKSSDAYGKAISYSYEIVTNELGQKVLKKIEIDPIGNRTEETYDARGERVSVEKKNSEGLLLSRIRTFRDLNRNPSLHETSVIVSGKVLDVQKIRSVFDPANHIQQFIYAQESSDQREETFLYGSHGEVKKRSNPREILYGYDEKGVLHSVSYKNAESEDIDCELEFDKRGSLVEEKSSSETITRKFSATGRLQKETIRDQWGSYSVQFTHDGQGRIQTIELPDKTYIEYTYDGPFVKKVSRRQKNNKEQYCHKVISQDLSGRMLEEILIGACGSRKCSWDLNGRKKSIKSDFFEEKGDYDFLGNFTSKETRFRNKEEKSVFAYDGLSQLSAETSLIEQIYEYDSLNNRLKKGAAKSILNGLNQLIESDSTIYTYDPSGNTETKTLQGKTTFFQWNPLGQLEQVQNPDFTLFYRYSQNGRRISKTLEPKNTKRQVRRFFYLGSTELGMIDEKGEILELKVPTDPNQPETSQAAAIELKSEIYAPIYDLHGNIVSLIDAQRRKVVESYRYSAFGEEQIFDYRDIPIAASSTGNPWRFRGKRIDPETKLVYFGGRYYDPSTGRWMSPDPLRLSDGPNLYAFVHNNPLTYTDFFGFSTESMSDAAVDKYFYGEYEPHCFCERHRDCKRGGDLQAAVSNALPTIEYDLAFEKVWAFGHPVGGHSQIFSLGREERPNLGLGVTNGVWNGPEDARRTAEYISDLAGGYNVRYVHNASHGYVVDLFECFMGLKFIATEPVKQLHGMWDDFFDNSSPDARFLMVGSSQGVLNIRNALLDYPADREKRISVIAIAPAAYVYRETCAAITHFRAKSKWRDFIPRIDREGAQRESASIVDLPSHPDAPYFDHYIDSPTYRGEVGLRVKRFLNNPR